MHSGRSWSLPSVQQAFEKTFWKKNNTPENYIVSKYVDTKYNIKPDKKITYLKIEAYVDEFVQDYVPNVVDRLYKYVL